MNSVSFRYYPDGYEGYQVYDKNHILRNRVCHYNNVPFINMGLLLGRPKSGSSRMDATNPYEFLGSCATELIHFCPSEMRERVLCQYLHINDKVLKRYKLPWFLPVTFGGLGLPSSGKYFPNEIDLKRARLLNEGTVIFSQLRQCLRKDNPFLPISRPKFNNWLTWEYVQKRKQQLIKDSVVTSTPEYFNDSNKPICPFFPFRVISEEKLEGMLAVESIFRSQNLNDVFCLNPDIDRKLQRLQVDGQNKYIMKVKGKLKRVSEGAAIDFIKKESVRLYMKKREKQWQTTLSNKYVLPEPYHVNINGEIPRIRNGKVTVPFYSHVFDINFIDMIYTSTQAYLVH